jgi:hypothetical protein
MILSIFWWLFATWSPFAQPASVDPFMDEQTKIMCKYIGLNFENDSDTSFGYIMDSEVGFPVENMIDFDPMYFFQKMLKNKRNYQFQIAFWFTFDTKLIYICPPFLLHNSNIFLTQLGESSCSVEVVNSIIYHFKVYLMRKLFFYPNADDRQKFLAEAMHFFNSTLKILIQRLKGDHLDLIEAMPRNFHFYQRCIGGETPRSILLSELSKLIVSKGSIQIGIHLQNLTFLFGALNWDESSHFGLGLISDQTPTKIGYFMLFLVFQREILSSEGAEVILYRKFRDSSLDMLNILHQKFPIFEVPKKINSSTKFKLSNGFMNTLSETKNNDGIIAKQTEIMQLTRFMFNTIIHF